MKYKVIEEWKDLFTAREDYYDWYEEDLAKKDFMKDASKYGLPYAIGIENNEVHYYKMTEC